MPPGENAATAWARHIGRHHYEPNCGEWRPIGANHCPLCPPRCPSCGVYYNVRADRR
jgi:hypothetical protein